MPIFVDARIPVIFAPVAIAGPEDAVLVEGEIPAPEGVPVARFGPQRPGHGIACACCAPRGPVATALHRLFLARARGEVAMFRRVLVQAGPAGEATVRDAVAQDAFLAGRYRLGAESGL
nr:hypothetical protein [Rhodovastum atsumiense]